MAMGIRRAGLAGGALALLADSARAEEAAKAGLPQFDPTVIPGQLFWLALSFGLLYALMAWVALPAIRKTQERRGVVVRGDLDAAAAANAKAKATQAEYEKALIEARIKAQAAVSGLAEAAEKESVAQQTARQRELNRRIAAAEVQIAVARHAALKDVDAAAVELADVIADRVAGLKTGAAR